jgi:mono/diheme cytochrome c family protein
MRGILLAALFATAACGSQPSEERKAEPPPVAFDGALVQVAAARVTHGKRLIDVLGCTGCHGANLQGERFFELYASNLTRELPKYSDAQFERLMRDGEHPTGREVWGMPSEIFQHLSEPDMAALIAYLRALKPGGQPTQPRLPWTKEVEDLIAKGEIKPAAAFVRDTKVLAPADLGAPHALGRYISRVTCAECHGPELKGNGGRMPDLIVAGSYTREEFERLMKQGVPTGGRKLHELMTAVAKERFSRMTPHERDALYAYLKARAEQPQ